MTVDRAQVIKRLEAAGFKYKDENERTEMMKRNNSVDRVFVPKRSTFTEKDVRAVLGSAGLSAADIDRFLRECVKH